MTFKPELTEQPLQIFGRSFRTAASLLPSPTHLSLLGSARLPHGCRGDIQRRSAEWEGERQGRELAQSWSRALLLSL